MKIYKVKGRTELAGTVSGALYCFMEGETKYYYLVNILNSKDIHIVKQPKREQLKEMDESKVDDYLKQFHLAYLQTGNANSGKMIKQPQNVNIEQLLLQKRHEELAPYYVWDWDATEFLISKLGKTYLSEDAKQVYASSHIRIYEISTETGVMKFTIKKPCKQKGSGEREYVLISIAEEKKQYEEKMRRLIAESGVTWNIAKIFINLADEKVVIQILKEIKKDKDNGEYRNKPYTPWNAYQYCNHLEEISGFLILVRDDNKKDLIYCYVSEK